MFCVSTGHIAVVVCVLSVSCWCDKHSSPCQPYNRRRWPALHRWSRGNTASLVDLLATVKELALGAFCQMDSVILVQMGFLSWCAEKLKLVGDAEDSEGFVRAANEDVVLGVKCCSGRIVCNGDGDHTVACPICMSVKNFLDGDAH